MTAPPQLNDSVESRRGLPRDTALVQALAKEGRVIAAELNLDISQNRMVRLILRYMREWQPGLDLRTWFLGYADPTGNTAVENVMRERKHHES